MNTSFERQTKEETTEEWITPPHIVAALGTFDVDPCASHFQKEHYAPVEYFIEDDGLKQNWQGRVWANPPYGRKAEKFVRKLIAHGNGIALIFARIDTIVWHEEIFQKADAVLFLPGRLCYLKYGENTDEPAGAASALVAFGRANADALLWSKLGGSTLTLNPQNEVFIN